MNKLGLHTFYIYLPIFTAETLTWRVKHVWPYVKIHSGFVTFIYD